MFGKDTMPSFHAACLLLLDCIVRCCSSVCRALGTYAVRADKQDGKLADNFFSAVQSYDFTLQRAVKTSKPVPGEAKQQLEATMQALDRQASVFPLPSQLLISSICQSLDAAWSTLFAPHIGHQGQDQHLIHKRSNGKIDRPSSSAPLI